MRCLGVYRPPPLAGCKAQRPLVQIDVWLSSSTPLVFFVDSWAQNTVFTLQMWAMNFLIGVIARVNLGLYVTGGQKEGAQSSTAQNPQSKCSNHWIWVFTPIKHHQPPFCCHWCNRHLTIRVSMVSCTPERAELQLLEAWNGCGELDQEAPSDRTMMWMIAIIGYYYDVYSYHHMCLLSLLVIG